MSGKQVFLQGISIAVFIVTAAVNVLARSTTLLNGVLSGGVSSLCPKSITPVGFTFAILSII